MISDGLIDEVKAIYQKDIRSKSMMTGIGYKELYKYFDDEISLEEAIDLIKKILGIMLKDNILGLIIK